MPDLVGAYRIQLRPGFGFDEAASLADYLAALGISHLYCSPYLQAAPGSTHATTSSITGGSTRSSGAAPPTPGSMPR